MKKNKYLIRFFFGGGESARNWIDWYDDVKLLAFKYTDSDGKIAGVDDAVIKLCASQQVA